MREASERASTPKHLWIVGVLAVLWNGFGAFDYLMTQTRNEAYMGQFTPEQLEYFYGFPSWVVATWALAVWGALAGSALLLLRSRWAVPVFAVSLISMVITTIHNYVLTNGADVSGAAASIITAVIFVVAVLLWEYSRRMRARGVLG